MVAGVVMPKPGEGKHKIKKLTNSVIEELFWSGTWEQQNSVAAYQ